MPNVFLSHSFEDKAFARKIAERLRQVEVDVWIDEAEINVGDSLLLKISDAIETADFVAVILSHNSVNSQWVQRELQMAMQKELADRKVRVLPIVIEPCEIPVFLRDKLYADFSLTDEFDKPFARLLRALGIEKPLSEIAPPHDTQPKKIPIGRQLDQAALRSREDNPVQSRDKLEGQLEGFLDIEVTGVDKARTYNPDSEKLLYNVYLTLSATPSSEWVEFFAAERRFPRHTMWRKAWIDGNFVVVHCVPDEIKRWHLSDVKEDVASANRQYREFLHHREQQAVQRKLRAEVRSKALDDALDSLDF